MQEIKVNQVIIGKQYEASENYEKFKKISSEKNIKINVVEAGNKIKIDKSLCFEVLWPSSKDMITDNAINNNSLVTKLVYKNFSMIFTGDIEEVAEKKIIAKYINKKQVLNADILKVAHHGSKTSSISEFINIVNPKYAVIGVGKDNKFGHPSDKTINTLIKRNVQIYRTDENGEIIILTNGTDIKIV